MSPSPSRSRLGLYFHDRGRKVVFEIVHAETAATRTSADDKKSAIAMRIGAVTNRDGEEIARRNIVPDVTGTRT